jgi:signal transduction histidine kinase
MRSLATIEPHSPSRIISSRRKLKNVVRILTGDNLKAVQLAAAFSQVQREVLKRELPTSVNVSCTDVNGSISLGLSWQFSMDDAPVQMMTSLFDSVSRSTHGESDEGFSVHMTLSEGKSSLDQHWESLVEAMSQLDRDELMEDLERRVDARTEELHLRAIELEEMRVEADRANEAKSSFLANMSHELRTPMNAIIGYTEMLQEEAEDLEETDDIFSGDLKKIHSAGSHLLALINDVLDLAKIESGKTELYNETFELAPLTEDIASTIHSPAGFAGKVVSSETSATPSSDFECTVLNFF